MKMSEEIPSQYKTLFARVNAENSKSKSDAIKAFCLRCVDYKYKRVRHCSVKNCPLYQMNHNEHQADLYFAESTLKVSNPIPPDFSLLLLQNQV